MSDGSTTDEVKSLLLGALPDGLQLVVELALQDDAFIDDRSDPIQKRAGVGEFVGVGQRKR